MNKKSIDINKESKGSYAWVNGLKLYYEIHGSGRPLVLLHGGLSTIETSKVEDLAGSVFQAAYARTAPNPEDWPTLIAKNRQHDREFAGWPPEAIRSIKAPRLLIIGDSDIVRPEHAVELFRLLGGGVVGDVGGLHGVAGRDHPAVGWLFLAHLSGRGRGEKNRNWPDLSGCAAVGNRHRHSGLRFDRRTHLNPTWL